MNYAWNLRLLVIALCACSAADGRGQTVTLPTTAIEGAGTLTNAGKLSLGAVAASNIVWTLQSADTSALSVPGSIQVPTGGSNVFFNLIVGDNLIVDGDRLVSVTATAPNFPTLTNWVQLLDNDPDHIRFGAVPQFSDTNTAFGVLLRAEKADGSLQTNFNLSLNIVAEGLEGMLPLKPTNTSSFAQGQKYLSFRVEAEGHAVRLRSLEYPGTSEPFRVIPPPFYASSQPVADIVWHPASQTLFASVPANGGVYSNTLVAIDPRTGLVTNSYPVGGDPSQIEMSPEGNYLYVALSNRTVLQRFDLNTRVAGLRFALGTNTSPSRFAYDFCVPPGLADSAVVEARDVDSIGNTYRAGLFRYASGVPLALPNFYATGAWLLESMDTGADVLLSSPQPSHKRKILTVSTHFRREVRTFK